MANQQNEAPASRQRTISRALLTAAIFILVVLTATPAVCAVQATTGDSAQKEKVEAAQTFSVMVECDNELISVTVSGETVAEALEHVGIELGKNDAVNYPLEDPVERNDRIVVTRGVGKTQQYQRTQKVEVPYETRIIPTTDLAPGQKQVEVKGVPGVRIDYYGTKTVDGVSQEVILNSEIVTPPVTEKIRVGATKPVSPLDFGKEFNEYGEPTEYKQVIRNQKAAGYSAKVGAKTASGLYAVVGHVAINPNVIPYGSKLYIKSTDGAFVYGYAVAADTGTALTQGIIGVDLFYDSYEASARNGIKMVDIFVLE